VSQPCSPLSSHGGSPGRHPIELPERDTPINPRGCRNSPQTNYTYVFNLLTGPTSGFSWNSTQTERIDLILSTAVLSCCAFGIHGGVAAAT
jgi:hypothetical protein